MQIAGLQKTTLVDYPGMIAATVFTRGCTFRCGFCHNPELVIPDKFNPLMDEKEIFDFFKKRKNQLEAVCITGGEPTIQKDLPEFIKKLKDLGYKIKLDTNGTNPKMLKELIRSGNLDYIAMDIKTTPEKYSGVVNLKSEFPISKKNLNDQMKNDELVANIKQSIALIVSSGVDYEFRTTICHPLHEIEDFREIGELIKGAKNYYIQNFVPTKQIDIDKKYSSFDDDELKNILYIMKKYVKKANIR